MRNGFARFGWVYKPETISGNSVEHSEHSGPNTIDRLSWFLTTNRTRLLRDLLEVVNLNSVFPTLLRLTPSNFSQWREGNNH